MPHETATFFFALLATALASGLILLGAGLVVAQIQGHGQSFVAPVKAVAVELAAMVAVACTAGSLYLSEVANFEPCLLCWVQRGFMYPAALLLVVALVAKRRGVVNVLVKVAALLAFIGLGVSVLHRWEQAAGDLAGFCDAANPCSARWVDHFGFVTIPTMAAVGFAAVLSLVALHLFWRSA